MAVQEPPACYAVSIYSFIDIESYFCLLLGYKMVHVHGFEPRMFTQRDRIYSPV